MQRIYRVMDTANTIGWASLGDVLLSQIKLANFLGYGPGFRHSLLQDPLLRKLVQLLARCIVNIEINAISANLELRLASDNINLNALEDFSFKNIKELQANSALFLISHMKISVGIRDRQVIWDKTPADLDPNNDHEPDNDMNGSDDVDPNADLEEGDEVIPLGDNMPCIADHPIIKQGIATKNKKLVSIISLCVLNYS